MTARSADEISSSNWLLGCEMLDRDFADYEQYKASIGPLGIKRLRMQAGWSKTERSGAATTSPGSIASSTTRPARALSDCGLIFGLFLDRQPGDGITNEAPLVHEVSRHDGVSRRMAIERALPMTKELLDFVIANSIVLLVVQHRNEHVQV